MADLTHLAQLPAAEPLASGNIVLVSQPSPTVTITAITIAALAIDNSYNDVGAGFVAAGFLVGDIISVEGFTGDVANNIVGGVVTAVTTTKLTIGGTDGDAIADELAGDSVTISKMVDRRTTLGEIATFFGL